MDDLSAVLGTQLCTRLIFGGWLHESFFPSNCTVDLVKKVSPPGFEPGTEWSRDLFLLGYKFFTLQGTYNCCFSHFR